MKLSEMKKDEKGIIRDIRADFELKNRLLSFGITPDEEIEVKGCSLAKQTMEVEVDGTLIALRKEEADRIVVER